MNDLLKSRTVRPIRVAPIGRFAKGRRQVEWPAGWKPNDGAGNAEGWNIDAAGRAVADSAIEASKSVFAVNESESAALRHRASSAYGSADTLDRAPSPVKRLTI